MQPFHARENVSAPRASRERDSNTSRRWSAQYTACCAHRSSATPPISRGLFHAGIERFVSVVLAFRSATSLRTKGRATRARYLCLFSSHPVRLTLARRPEESRRPGVEDLPQLWGDSGRRGRKKVAGICTRGATFLIVRPPRGGATIHTSVYHEYAYKALRTQAAGNTIAPPIGHGGVLSSSPAPFRA